jgi:ProQ/FINO family
VASFPKCFFQFEGRRQPLKLGIHSDLEASLGDAIGSKTLRKALRVYVANLVYLKRIKSFCGARRLRNSVGLTRVWGTRRSGWIWNFQLRMSRCDQERLAGWARKVGRGFTEHGKEDDLVGLAREAVGPQGGAQE